MYNYQQGRGTKTIDHIITNIPDKVIYSNDLLSLSISDHDAPYIIAKISTPKYQTLYKFIRYIKEFDIGKFKEDLKQIPFLKVYSSNDSEDQFNVLNELILHCSKKQALKELNLLDLQHSG